MLGYADFKKGPSFFLSFLEGLEKRNIKRMQDFLNKIMPESSTGGISQFPTINHQITKNMTISGNIFGLFALG
jgi:hypothetical protein